MENARAFSMRMNDDEMRILRALYKNSGATGGLPAFVKSRVLDSKTVTASLKSILEMEVALEKGLGCIKKTTDLIRLMMTRLKVFIRCSRCSWKRCGN